MNHRQILRRIAALLAAAALAVLPTAFAHASGFQLFEQSASGLGNAYAGQAAGVKDASALFFNPAALTRLDGKQFVLAVNGIGLSTTFSDGGTTRPSLGGTPFPVPLGSEGGNAGKWVPVPNGYFSWQAAKQVWVGVGVNVPFGLESDWTTDWMGRFHALNSKIQAININPSVAFKVNDQFSIGAGVSYQKLTARLSQSVPYGGVSYGVAASVGGAAAAAGILQQLGGLAGLAREGEAVIDGDSTAWGFNVGAQLRLGEKGRFGATYRSKVNHDLDGDATFNNAPSFATTGPLGALGAGLNARFANGPVTAKVDLPDTFSAALAYEGEKFELLADWTWTGWSSIQALTILRTDSTTLNSVPLNFEDTWRAGLGSNVKLNEKWTLRLGVAYDKAPVQDLYRTPRLPDNDRVWAAGGFQWRLSKKSAIDLGYSHVFLSEGSSNLPNQDTPTSSPRGNLVGTYAAKVDIVSVQYRLSF
jgi:long-chain fatty acid transport protein